MHGTNVKKKKIAVVVEGGGSESSADSGAPARRNTACGTQRRFDFYTILRHRNNIKRGKMVFQ